MVAVGAGIFQEARAKRPPPAKIAKKINAKITLLITLPFIHSRIVQDPYKANRVAWH